MQAQPPAKRTTQQKSSFANSSFIERHGLTQPVLGKQSAVLLRIDDSQASKSHLVTSRFAYQSFLQNRS